MNNVSELQHEVKWILTSYFIKQLLWSQRVFLLVKGELFVVMLANLFPGKPNLSKQF